MLDTFSYKCLKVNELKLCFKRFDLNVKKLKKRELFDTYNRCLAAFIIQKAFREHFYKNATDHITLEKVNHPCFIYRLKNNCYFYTYESIIKYIMKTGDTRDPMTRIQYSDDDLIRIDTSVKYYFPDTRYSSTLKIKKNVSYAKKIKNRENEILSFQMRLDELKNTFIDLLAYNVGSWDIGTDPIIIDSVRYSSLQSFIQSSFHEAKIVFTNLKNYCSFYASTFKQTFLEEIEHFEESVLKEQLKNVF